jgi:hypothetical protein
LKPEYNNNNNNNNDFGGKNSKIQNGGHET